MKKIIGYIDNNDVCNCPAYREMEKQINAKEDEKEWLNKLEELAGKKVLDINRAIDYYNEGDSPEDALEMLLED